MNPLSIAAVVVGMVAVVVGTLMGFGTIPGAAAAGLPLNASTAPTPSLHLSPLAWTASGTTVTIWSNGTEVSLNSPVVDSIDTLINGNIASVLSSGKVTFSYPATGGAISFKAVVTLAPGTYTIAAYGAGTSWPTNSPVSANSSSVVLIVTSGGVGPPPSPAIHPSFRYTQQAGTLSLTFSDTSTASSGVTLQSSKTTWAFSDGVGATGAVVTRTFSAPGAFSVTETVAGITTANGTALANSTAKSFYVSAGGCIGCLVTLTPQFRWTSANLSVSFIDYSVVGNGTISNFNWSFGDGGSGSGQAPVHVYRSPGPYVVHETVTAQGVGGPVIQMVSTTVLVTVANTTGCVSGSCAPPPAFLLTPLTGAVLGFGVGMFVVAAVPNPKTLLFALLSTGAGALAGFVI